MQSRLSVMASRLTSSKFVSSKQRPLSTTMSEMDMKPTATSTNSHKPNLVPFKPKAIPVLRKVHSLASIDPGHLPPVENYPPKKHNNGSPAPHKAHNFSNNVTKLPALLTPLALGAINMPFESNQTSNLLGSPNKLSSSSSCYNLQDMPEFTPEIPEQTLSPSFRNSNSNQATPSLSLQSATASDEGWASEDLVENSCQPSPDHDQNYIDFTAQSSSSNGTASTCHSCTSQRVSVQQARSRNYLQGSIGSCGLLGSNELKRIFPSKKLHIFVGTWNMNGKAPPAGLDELLLPSHLDIIPDLACITSQESHPDRESWEINLQATLGPSHVLFHSLAYGTLHMAIFLRRDLIWVCSEPEESWFSTRPGSAFKTKGAVAISFSVFGTSFLFVGCHLTAHDEKVNERVADVKRIATNLNLPKLLPVRNRQKDATHNFDCVFWSGDLNFRLDLPRQKVLDSVNTSQINLVNIDELLKNDQLRKLMHNGKVLRGFHEAPITFYPTYKYTPGTNSFENSAKQRVPSYTDRIIYKERKPNVIQVGHYKSVMGLNTSDHKPVWGIFTANLKPGKDTIPLAAGIFNRTVYLEGIKKRLQNSELQERSNNSTCSIQ